jgi:hypothetical protein
MQAKDGVCNPQRTQTQPADMSVGNKTLPRGPRLTLPKRHAEIQQGLADRVLLGRHRVRDHDDGESDPTSRWLTTGVAIDLS